MARKTIDVAAVKDRANTMLEVQSTPEARRAVAVLLESVLHATGNYRGFKYQISEYNTTEEFHRSGMVLRENYDDTRRYYY
jgi:hypothetical protein